MKESIRIPLIILMAMIGIHVGAASRLKLTVKAADTGEPVEFAAITMILGDKTINAMADVDGAYSAMVADGDWTIKTSAVGFQPRTTTVKVNGDTSYDIKMNSVALAFDEVVVTAQEGRGFTSESIIDHQAMQHLQPSSFTDLLELLPGQTTKDPDMRTANLVNLRSAAPVNDDYATSTMGTSFVVDGVPVNTSADMATTPDATRADRMTAGRGVDMRTLSTDDIESVEIVRGIASAEYGEVTSGVINIKRKSRGNKFEARFKADQQGQIFYVGKGFELSPSWGLNMSADYLDSKADPRNNRENYKRVTASLRSSYEHDNAFMALTWTSALDYNGTWERDKNDPDLTINNTIDYYTSDRNALKWNNTLQVTPHKSVFTDVTLTAGVSYSDEHIVQQKTVASSRIYPMPVSLTPGANYVGFLPMIYQADLDVYSKPFTAYARAATSLRIPVGITVNRVKAGAEWNMSKNYGDGQVYDLMRPLVAGNTSRPRAYNDIRAMNQVSSYVECITNFMLGNNELEMQLGVRNTQLTNLPSRYALHGKAYFDPRINLRWTLPQAEINSVPLFITLAGGFGWHTKMPNASQLYPDPRYTDQVQLNYFHNDEAYRTMNVMTFVEDLTNPGLKAARNFKWEARLDFAWQGNHLSATYFREDMKDGFRLTPEVSIYNYNQYDASAYGPYTTGTAPTIDELPSRPMVKTATIGHWDNGSRTLKEGVEYTFSSMRIPKIRTRVTVSGAWFKTTLSNSQALWYKPTMILAGEELPYVGLYDDVDGSVYESFNTNIVLDTDIPRLKLNFSISVQNIWYSSTRTLFRTGVPTHYMDGAGCIYPYTEASASDPRLQHLVRTYSATAFEERRIPAETAINLKATKTMWGDRIGIALYVNRLLSITPDYYQFGVLHRRYTSPYFGMELNLKF